VDLFLRLAKQQGLPVEKKPVEDEAIQRCVLAGFADQLALRMDEGTLRCRLVHGRRGQLARESAVHHRSLFVAADVREIEGREVQVILSLATAVDPEWLRELWPDDFHEELAVRYDAAAKRVTAERQTLFRDLQLASKPAEPPADEAARLLADAVSRGELVLRKWDRAADQWIARVNVLAAACPDLGLPVFGDDDRRAVIEQLCLGAFSYKDLRDRDVLGPLKDWLSGAQRALVERLTPERVTLPSGRAVRLEYTPGQPPALAAKIQDLYGLDETPRIARGRIPLVVQILGPNFRPVQVTQDLANFWKETYPQVKQELKRKYPKHEWR
jgi:ATP-dependent helicase HrpB